MFFLISCLALKFWFFTRMLYTSKFPVSNPSLPQWTVGTLSGEPGPPAPNRAVWEPALGIRPVPTQLPHMEVEIVVVGTLSLTRRSVSSLTVQVGRYMGGFFVLF